MNETGNVVNFRDICEKTKKGDAETVNRPNKASANTLKDSMREVVDSFFEPKEEMQEYIKEHGVPPKAHYKYDNDSKPFSEMVFLSRSDQEENNAFLAANSFDSGFEFDPKDLEEAE